MKSAVLLVVAACVVVIIGARPLDSLQGTDFPDFYCAARMLLDGHGHQLYDAELQRQYQGHYAGRVGTLYIHPPFEAAVYLGVAWLPLRQAYWLWSVVSVALLAAGVRRLAKQALPWDWRLLFAASLSFVPLLLCLLQGQDSVLLLLLVVLAFSDLRRDRAFAAGCWLCLGLFKFQLVLPLLLVLILTKNRSGRKALALGFVSMAMGLAAMSAAIAGWSVFRVYPDFLQHLQQQPFAGIIPQAMANFRGLTYIVLRGTQFPWSEFAVSILSAAALLKILSDWKRARLGSAVEPALQDHFEFDLAFANTVLFSLLVSYHLNPHDLCLLLLPIVVTLHHTLGRGPSVPRFEKWTILGLLATFSLPPLQLWALRAGIYALASVPLFLLFLVIRPSQYRPSQYQRPAEEQPQ